MESNSPRKDEWQTVNRKKNTTSNRNKTKPLNYQAKPQTEENNKITKGTEVINTSKLQMRKNLPNQNKKTLHQNQNLQIKNLQRLLIQMHPKTFTLTTLLISIIVPSLLLSKYVILHLLPTFLAHRPWRRCSISSRQNHSRL